MKIRTDFVTNSSSSNYTVVSINTCDGRQFDLDKGETMWDNRKMCRFEDGKLIYSYRDTEGEKKERTLETVQQLLAVIYFNDLFSAVFEPSPYEVIYPVFMFLIGEMSPRELLEALEDVKGFEDLQDIDPDDFDDRAELRKALLKSLASCLSHIGLYVDMKDEQLLQSYKEVALSVGNLNDIANVTVHASETNWGEFTNIYGDRLEDYVMDGNHPFVPVSTDAPEYDEMVTHWINVMESEVLMGDTGYDLQDCVRKALASGNVRDLIPDTIESYEEILYQIADV